MRDLKQFTPDKYAEWLEQNSDVTHLSHYIRYYGDVIPPKICDDLVIEFDSSPELQRERTQGNDHFRFMQLSISENYEYEPWTTTQDIFAEATSQALGKYSEDIYFDDTQVFPTNLGLEEFRINKTMNNGKDGFGNHVDVGDYASARRFITVLYYLNDIEEGGDAAFPALGLSFKPTKGSVLIFPSTWQFLHCGLKPISDPKYILTTFVHYT